jgi:ribonuclease HII
MPWVVGIDEAGYGPNLGPLVQAAVALHLPDHDLAGWETLKPVVRRCGEKADGRLLIDDSKKVYTRGGFAALERSVILTAPWSCSVAEMIRKAGLDAYREELLTESWYDPAETLPIIMDPESRSREYESAFTSLSIDRSSEFCIGSMVASIVPSQRFNRICDEHGSKAAVLGRGLVEIIGQLREELSGIQGRNGPIHISCDKMGGRNFYAAMLQEAFPEGWIVAERESADESRYRVEMLDRPVTITFRPRADGDSVAVALASMLCKYLREVCMRQFNRFWAKHVPGIQPTAGYPVDAKRFFAEIKPAMEKLGLTDDQVWRKR